MLRGFCLNLATRTEFLAARIVSAGRGLPFRHRGDGVLQSAVPIRGLYKPCCAFLLIPSHRLDCCAGRRVLGLACVHLLPERLAGSGQSGAKNRLAFCVCDSHSIKREGLPGRCGLCRRGMRGRRGVPWGLWRTLRARCARAWKGCRRAASLARCCGGCVCQ